MFESFGRQFMCLSCHPFGLNRDSCKDGNAGMLAYSSSKVRFFVPWVGPKFKNIAVIRSVFFFEGGGGICEKAMVTVMVLHDLIFFWWVDWDPTYNHPWCQVEDWKESTLWEKTENLWDIRDKSSWRALILFSVFKVWKNLVRGPSLLFWAVFWVRMILRKSAWLSVNVWPVAEFFS